MTVVQKESLCDHDMLTRATEQIRNRLDMVKKLQKESVCGHDMVTGATEQVCNRHDMVTGVQKESLCGHDKVTGVYEEVTYCSSSTSSGKQKKNCSTSQPQFRSENTPATIEADQTLLTLQQLANNISAKFHNNINRISKLPKSLTTAMATFDGKPEKFELFEDLLQTGLKVHSQLTEDDRINYFHSLTREDALQTFKKH